VDAIELSIFGYANGATLWHFRSRDPAAEIVAPRYFDASADMLRAGDFILVNLVSDTATSGGLLTVESVRDQTVRVCPVAGPFPPAPRSEPRAP
jgi:hypothetical protein